jgi:hypothetical protein
MNILDKSYCYLGGNLENTEDALSWREKLTGELSKMGIVCLDPTTKMFQDQIAETEEERKKVKTWRENGEFDKVHLFMKEVIRRDLRAVDLAYFTIFKIEPTRPTWGTVHELVLASQQRKPVMLLIDNKKNTPIWLMGMINMDFVFETIDELTDYLSRINAGSERMDSKYWKLPTLRD